MRAGLDRAASGPESSSANFGQSALNCPFKWARLNRLTRRELLPLDQLTAINLAAFTPLHSDWQTGRLVN